MATELEGLNSQLAELRGRHEALQAEIGELKKVAGQHSNQGEAARGVFFCCVCVWGQVFQVFVGVGVSVRVGMLGDGHQGVRKRGS